MTTLTNWWLDFDEVFNDGTTEQTSYGPFEYDVNGDISVQQFLDDINNKFVARASTGFRAPPTYEISAQILGGYYNDDAPKNNFAVKYTITAVDPGGLFDGLSEYKIAFRSGPHGVNSI